MATELLERQHRNPFLAYLITMDETWVPFNNPNPHNQWLLPNQRPDPTPVPDFRQRKIMLSIKALEIAEEKEAVAQFGSSDSGASLGDILGAALKNRGGE